MPHLASLAPHRAIEGGRVTLSGDGLIGDDGTIPEVLVQEQRARVVFASPSRLSFLVPAGIADGTTAPVRVGTAADETLYLSVGAPIATGLHQVDSPVLDRHGNVYLTYSGTRGQQVPVSIFRVGPAGTRDPFASGIVNPTSLAFDHEERLYVSSRFEGTVYRLNDDGGAEPFASDLGIACGLAFGPDGSLYVGDRSGTIFEVDPRGHARALASLPASVAAFHLAANEDGLFVTGPTLSPSDPVYFVSYAGEVDVYSRAFGRPQGLAIGPDGALYVVEALAGNSGLFRLSARDAAPELVLAGSGLIGVAFDRDALIVCTNDTAYQIRAQA
jgi:sugar lactone lactonase YvrE